MPLTAATSTSHTSLFESLPNEVIGHIAAFTHCQDAISLMRTNWRFYNTIKNRIVFKGMIQTQTLSSMKCLPSSLEADKSIVERWARLALADQKAWQLINWDSTKGDEDGSDEGQGPKGLEAAMFLWIGRKLPTSSQYDQPTRLLSYIPQLIASHHPIVTSTQPLDLLSHCVRVLNDSSIATVEFLHALDFCLTSLILQHYMPTAINASTAHNMVGDIYDLIQVLDEFDALSNSCESTASCAMFMCALVQFFRMHYTLHAPLLRINPPIASTIPFTTFMDLPTLFSPNTMLDLEASYLSNMTSPTFLLDGKWASYYSLSADFANNPPMTFQPPVTDVQFSLSPIQEDGDDETTFLTATGDDSFGIFQAEGIVTTGGRVRMLETNYRGQEWLWDLSVCPFGLFGTWGTPTEVNGFLWMFKEEWAFERSVPRAVRS